jgi:hypothetical protein
MLNNGNVILKPGKERQWYVLYGTVTDKYERQTVQQIHRWPSFHHGKGHGNVTPIFIRRRS